MSKGVVTVIDAGSEAYGAGFFHTDQCMVCGDKPKKLIIIGQVLDYDSATTYLCKKCVNRVVKAAKTIEDL